MSLDHPIAEARTARTSRGWLMALCGLALVLFSLVALSGPGRIDIVDGQTRYEVARSLVDHGDLQVRDPRVWFGVFPGRDGRLFSSYRLPQSLLGAGAILVADATGPQREARRHFFFVLLGALACGVLGVLYACFFRRGGSSPRSALGWGAAGVLATPSWFYGTSTFDDILGTVFLVAAMVLALSIREGEGWALPLLVGLLAAIVFHCKPPLGIFLLPLLAALYDCNRSWRSQVPRLAAAMAGFLLGPLSYWAYEWYKFTPETAAIRSQLLRIYVPLRPGDPVAALSSLVASPAAGATFYCPPLFVALAGFPAWRRRERPLFWALISAAAIFVAFLATLTIWKGDPAWGPRYHTPLFAVLWLLAPAGAVRLGRRATSLLLAAGLSVQLLGLAVDPHRLYVERGLPSAFYWREPWRYFDPAIAHLLNRPREIAEAWHDRDLASPEFSPAPEPTFAFPVLDSVGGGPAAVRHYQILAGYRPWWWSLQALPGHERPLHLGSAALWLLSSAAIGGLLLAVGWRLGVAPVQLIRQPLVDPRRGVGSRNA